MTSNITCLQCGGLLGPGDRFCAQCGGPTAAAQADPREAVLMRYCNGRGRFSQDKKFINLQMQMFDPYGRPVVGSLEDGPVLRDGGSVEVYETFDVMP